MIDLIGEHRRRAYAHDLYYGMHQLYTLYGKPWHGSTEGGEHAHQEVKKMFAHLSCHSKAHASKFSGVYHQVLRNSVIKAQLCRERAAIDLNVSKYNAARANVVFNVTQRVSAPAPARGAAAQQRKSKTVVVTKQVGLKTESCKPGRGSKMAALRESIANRC